MKRIILIVLFILTLSSQAFATDYFGCASAAINADNTFCATPSGSCAGSDAVSGATAIASGNNLYANGCTITMPAANINIGTGKISTEDGDGAGAAIAGGAFTAATATVNGTTFTGNIVSGTTVCLAITGATNANPVYTIIGNITGGSGTNIYGVSDGHTVGTTVYGSGGSPITVTGGSASTGHGLYVTSTGPVIIYGNGVGGTGYGISGPGNNGSITITGNCTSSATNYGCVCVGTTATCAVTGNCVASTGVFAGCYGSGSAITVSGNIIGTTTGVGANGKIIWNPTSSGTTWNYIKIQGKTAGNFLYLTESPAVAKVENNYTYGFDGATYYTGTLAGGAGGSWAE